MEVHYVKACFLSVASRRMYFPRLSANPVDPMWMTGSLILLPAVPRIRIAEQLHSPHIPAIRESIMSIHLDVLGPKEGTSFLSPPRTRLFGSREGRNMEFPYSRLLPTPRLPHHSRSQHRACGTSIDRWIFLGWED